VEIGFPGRPGDELRRGFQALCGAAGAQSRAECRSCRPASLPWIAEFRPSAAASPPGRPRWTQV